MTPPNNALDQDGTDGYLSFVDAGEDPAPPRDPPTSITTWRDRLPKVFDLVLGGLGALVLAGAGLGLVISTGPTHPGAAPTVATTPATGASITGALVPGPSRAHAASGPVGTTRKAQFELDSGVSAIVVRAVDLGDVLFRATTPESSAVVPRASRDGDRVRVRVTRGPRGVATGTLEVTLNSRVAWQVTLVGGSAAATVDLRGATVGGVEFVGGVERIELWLAGAHGAVPVRMSGGARDMTVHAPQGVPVRVAIGHGAATVTVDGAPHNGIAAGTRFLTTGWQQAPDWYDLDLAGGVGQLTIDRY